MLMEIAELWQKTLTELELKVSRANFHTWLKDSSLKEKKDGIAIVGLNSDFAKEWIESKYHKFILKILRDLDSEIKSVEYSIEPAVQVSPLISSLRKAASKNSGVGLNQLDFMEFKINPETGLNPKYQLENFIVGSFNELAYAAASSVIEKPGEKYNPLFIYGGVGLGKTHLIQATGNKMKEIYPDKKVKYATSEKFTIEVVNAIRNQKTEELRNKYRLIDVLIMDDVQFLSGKDATQSELFHTFNALNENGKQVIISSDRPPKSIPALEERLRSRFEGGMIADISVPDYETRLAILKQKAQEKKYFLPEKILEFIAAKIQNNIRELEGSLNSIAVNFANKNIPFSTQEAEKILAHTIQPRKVMTFKDILKSVLDFYDLEEKDLCGKCRVKNIVKPRQVIMYLLRDEMNMSYPSIGARFGNRDHTTVIHACEKIGKELISNTVFAQEINLIKERLYGKQ